MGEAKNRKANGSGPRGPQRHLRAVQGPPKAEVRLLAKQAEIAAASYLVDFASTLGIPQYRAQVMAIAYTTKVPAKALIGKAVEVFQVPDAYVIEPSKRLTSASDPPPLADEDSVRRTEFAMAPVEEPKPEETTIGAPPEPEPKAG